VDISPESGIPKNLDKLIVTYMVKCLVPVIQMDISLMLSTSYSAKSLLLIFLFEMKSGI